MIPATPVPTPARPAGTPPARGPARAAARGSVDVGSRLMYESLQGRLLSKEPARCVVEVGGIGYLVHVPLSSFERLPALGADVFLRLHLVVREDDWRLFGFASEEERELFRACLKVSGVGPVTALALLSGLSPREFRAAVVAGDVKALTRVKGIGKKTAERMVVELRDALALQGVDGAGAAAPAGEPAGPLAEAALALVALGLDPADAQSRLSRIPRGAELPVGDLLRLALRRG